MEKKEPQPRPLREPSWVAIILWAAIAAFIWYAIVMMAFFM
jgi:hypothetical protein